MRRGSSPPDGTARSAADVVRLVDQLREGSLEALEEEVEVDDLVHADRLGCDHGLSRRLRNAGLDLLDRAAGDGEHDDECHLALRACDLEVKALFGVAEDLHIAALEVAPAHRAVVEPSPVADELDDAHRVAHITPHPQVKGSLPAAFDTGATG